MDKMRETMHAESPSSLLGCVVVAILSVPGMMRRMLPDYMYNRISHDLASPDDLRTRQPQLNAVLMHGALVARHSHD